MEQEDPVDPIPENERERSERRIWTTRNVVAAGTIFLFVVGAAIGAFYLAGPGSTPGAGGAGPGGVPVTAASAMPTAYVISTTARATVVQAPAVPVTPKEAGWVRQILVQPGQKVHTGDPIMALQAADDSGSAALSTYQTAMQNLQAAQSEAADQRNGLSAAQSALSTEETKLAQAKVDRASAQAAIKQLQEQVDAANQDLKTQNVALQKTEALFKQGAASQSEMDQAKAAQGEAEVRLNQARIAQDSARTSLTVASDNVKGQQEVVARANAEVQSAKANLAASQNRIKALRAQADKSQAQLQAARSSERAIVVQAPTRGTVTSISAKNGLLVTPAMEVALVQPEGASVATFDVSDGEASKLRAGMPAAVQAPKTKKMLPARIAAIPPLPTGGPARNRVIVEIRDPKSTLKPGTTVPVQIPVRRVKGEGVPKEAIKTAGGKPYVWVVSDNKVERRGVDVAGYENNVAVVDKGLKSKDLVVLRSAQPLTNGTPVEIRGSLENRASR